MTYSVTDTQHNNGLNGGCRYTECRIFCYAECHYAECRYADCCGAVRKSDTKMYSFTGFKSDKYLWSIETL